MAEQFIVNRSGDRPLRFTGELLWSGGTSLNNAFSDYSGETGRAEDIQVYRTTSDKYVVHIHHTTQWQGEHHTDEAVVLPSLSECLPYLSERIPTWLLEDFIAEVGAQEVAEDVE